VTKPGSFAHSALLARRLVERGVRVVQVLHRGWDQHGDLPKQLGNQCSEVLVYLVDAEGRPRAVASTLPASAHAPLLQSIEARRVRPEGPGGEPLAAAGAGGDAGPPVHADIGGAAYVGQETPLRSATGEMVGGVVTLRSRARELAPYEDLRRRIVLAGGAGLALAFALAFVVARQITRPIVALTEAARRAAAGDFSGAGVSVDSTGEVAELADAVRSVLSNLQERQALAELVERARALPDPAGDEPTLPHVAPAAFLPGATLARRYTIDAVVGVGGNGVVYRATDRELGETVAIKTLRPEVLAGGRAALDRLKDEIRLARRISHAGVVRIHDFGEADGAYFVTMEHVAGMSLAELLRRLGRVPVAQAIGIGKQLCGALAAAHAQGVIHRDVKPQNLMLQPDGTLKVLDFGVARLAERSVGLTTAGLVVGTPAYMAPEQLLDEEVDARADVYAAGVVLYEALTGRRPLEAPNPAAVIARVLTETPTRVSQIDPAVPEALSHAIERALSRDRESRPRTMAELHDLLVRAGRSA
jgi:serine/threonine-protein kinase